MSDEADDSDDEVRAIVIDSGSQYIKAGFAGDEAPRAVFANAICACTKGLRFEGGLESVPTTAVGAAAIAQQQLWSGMAAGGTGRYSQQLSNSGRDDGFAGHSGARPVLRWPVDRGLVVDWPDMERVWRHTFYTELAADPQVRFPQPPPNPSHPQNYPLLHATHVWMLSRVPACTECIDAPPCRTTRY